MNFHPVPRILIKPSEDGTFHMLCVWIDRKHHWKIFEMFHRLKQVEDEEGTGLGLAIVERTVNSHGGKIWVEPEKGKGATFYFICPNRHLFAQIGIYLSNCITFVTHKVLSDCGPISYNSLL